MRPATITSSDASGGTVYSPLLVWDSIQSPFNTSLWTKVTGTATYTIEHTPDDVFASNFNPATATWYNHDDAIMVNATANQKSNLMFPARASRISQTAGSGSVQLTGIQGVP